MVPVAKEFLKQLDYPVIGPQIFRRPGPSHGPKMGASTTAKLRRLRDFLGTKPNEAILRMYLRKDNVGLLAAACFVNVHRQWSPHPPYHLTELGITTYRRQEIHNSHSKPAGPHAEVLFMKLLWGMHLRIRPHAHLPSSASDFHFGTTVFVTQDEALSMLHDIWHQPMDDDDPEQGLRPILYMSFGNNDGMGKVRRGGFDFDPSTYLTTVATLDAQVIPNQAYITRSQTASLDYLLHAFKITPWGVDNGGNAAMYASVVAVLSALRKELYESVDNPKAIAGQYGPSASKSAQDVMQLLMERPCWYAPFGAETYCWRCGGAHAIPDCPDKNLACSKCARSSLDWRKENAGTHIDRLCVFSC